VVSYRVMLDVPAELVGFVSGLLAAHRRQIGTRKGTRRLTCYKQALFALAWFRDKGDIPRLGRGFGLPQSTAYRYLDEVIEVLAARAPGLQEALERALAAGAPYLILDGKVVDTDRCREKTLSRKGKTIDLWFAGKTHDFGGNIQALFYPSGIPLWVSDVLPGNVHDLAAARENVLGVLRPFLEAMPVLADPGYEGAGHGVHVPVKKPAGVKELGIDTRARNALLRSVRCLGERGFALLTQRWQTLQHVTASPGRIGLWGIHLTGVACGRGTSSRGYALSAVYGRVPGMVPHRRRLPGLPGLAALAWRFRLPVVRARGGLAAGRWPV